MVTGHDRVVVGLTPANGTLQFGILGDSIDYERLIQAEFEDDLAVPVVDEESVSRQLARSLHG